MLTLPCAACLSIERERESPEGIAKGIANVDKTEIGGFSFAARRKARNHLKMYRKVPLQFRAPQRQGTRVIFTG